MRNFWGTLLLLFQEEEGKSLKPAENFRSHQSKAPSATPQQTIHVLPGKQRKLFFYLPICPKGRHFFPISSPGIMSWILSPSDFSHLPGGLQSSGRLIPASPSPAQSSVIFLHPCRGSPSATRQLKPVGQLILTQYPIIGSAQTTSWPWCSFALKPISLKFHLLYTHSITLAAQRGFKRLTM